MTVQYDFQTKEEAEKVLSKIMDRTESHDSRVELMDDRLRRSGDNWKLRLHYACVEGEPGFDSFSLANFTDRVLTDFQIQISDL